MREPVKLTLVAMGTSVAVAGLLLGLRAAADGLQSTDQVPRLLAYHGSLEKDGVPVEGQVPLTFRLYDGAAGTAMVWQESLTVQARTGSFSALLGSTSQASVEGLTQAVEAADDLYLEIVVNDGGTPVTLGQRQRFVPVPYSHWTSVGTNLTARGVDGLGTGGKLLLNGNTKAAVEVHGGLDVYGPQVSFSYHPDKGNGGAAMAHAAGDTLVLNPGGELEGGTVIDGAFTTTPKLVSMKRVSFYNGATVVDTGMSSNSWACILGGVKMSTGIIQTAGVADHILWLYTYPEGGTWKAKADLASVSVNEFIEAGLVCFRKGLVDVASWW
ncbi:MAG: hypothetical protein FJ098_15925 [Deltaproteobacteria bacterium]|nr:hypothetical protein [Deltaproteobacteria bacterium]